MPPDTACPLCNLPSQARSGAGPVRFWRCERCDHEFATAPSFDARVAYADAAYAGFRHDARFAATIDSLMRRLIVPQLRAGARLLDVGCGNGTALAVSAKLGMRVKGVDISEPAIAHCKSQGFDASVADFPTHQFGDDRFDVITFWDVLEHLPEPLDFVTRARELLAPGGLLLAKVPAHGHLSLFLAHKASAAARVILQAPHHLQFFSRRSLRELVRQGFGVAHVEPLGATRTPTQGGTLRRRVARALVNTIQRASGDGGLLLLAKRSD